MNDTVFEQARRLLDEQRYGEAVEAFSNFLALYPDSEGAYGNRGLAQLNLGQDRQALADFESVISLNPDDAMGHAMAAEALRYLGRPAEALANLAKALELNQQEPMIYFTRAWLFFYAGQYACATDDLEKFTELSDSPDEIEDLLDICRVLRNPLARAEDGRPLDSEESREDYLRQNGYSLDLHPDSEYEASGRFCTYAHCVRTMPRRSPESGNACPVTGYECPGGTTQAAQCQTHPPLEL